MIPNINGMAMKAQRNSQAYCPATLLISCPVYHHPKNASPQFHLHLNDYSV